jgi:uncharacterized zinc-type alcohol dehydrogenase-like protein
MFETQTTPVERVTSNSLPSRAYAAQTSTSELAPWSFERRAVGPHDVLIEIRYCGVCHTDIYFLRNDLGFSGYPIVPGHEIVGVVTRTGGHVKKFKEGDVVGSAALLNLAGSVRIVKKGKNSIVLTERYTPIMG